MGAAAYWDSLATDLEAAKWAVWSVPPETYEESTVFCVEQFAHLLGRVPRRVLDVGCGIGRVTIPLAVRFPSAEVVGHDPAARMIDLAAAEARRAGVERRVSWHCDDRLPAGGFDAAVSVVVLQHLTRQECRELVAEVADRLVDGGVFAYQTVTNVEFEDEGHVPPAVVESWATDAGLRVTATELGVFYPDWIWVAARKGADDGAV